jgi:hypothetical protein
MVGWRKAMEPINSRRAIRQRAKIAEEAVWRQQGVEAAEKGLSEDQWPRLGEKYSNIWYRCKNAWIAGYRTSIGMPLSRTQVEAAEIKPRSLNERLYFLLEAKQAMSMRQILRSFSSHNLEHIKAILQDWESQGYIKVTGKGTRSNPVTIEKI